MDWKEKYKEYVSSTGRLKRGVSSEVKKEILQYRVGSAIKVIGEYTVNSQPIECGCESCGHIWFPLAKNLLSGSACPKCFGGTEKVIETAESETVGHIPKYIWDKLPSYAAVEGLKEPENRRGVVWYPKTDVTADLFFIMKEGNEYHFMISYKNRFPEDRYRYIKPYYSNIKAMREYFPGHPDNKIPNDWILVSDVYETQYASVIKYILEVKFKKNKYYYNVDEGFYRYKLNETELSEVINLKDIEEILNW
jgi:Zn finger protein HypA/HybF involved in hydrogenase expression